MSSRSSALQTYRTREITGIPKGFASASLWSHSNDLAKTKGLLQCRRSFVFMKLAMLAY
jgi:hypothetical protein